jgi:hypothetical protein
MKAKVAKFYGWNDSEINNLSYPVFMQYYEAITVIEAQECLVAMNIQDYPRMKKEGRKKFYRSVRKAAYPESLKKPMEFEEFFEKVKSGR